MLNTKKTKTQKRRLKNLMILKWKEEKLLFRKPVHWKKGHQDVILAETGVKDLEEETDVVEEVVFQEVEAEGGK